MLTILCPGEFDYLLNKTGNMFLRYRPEDVCSVIDPENAGQTAQDVLGYGGEIPIVSTFLEASDYIEVYGKFNPKTSTATFGANGIFSGFKLNITD